MLVRQILSFAVVGVIGFCVDAGVLTAVITWTPLNLYSGRVVSFLAAVTVTWILNRNFTFRGYASRHITAEWLRFSAMNAVGSLANLGSYALLITRVPVAHASPVLAVAAGSLCGFAINFSLSKTFVFRAGAPLSSA